MIRDHAPYEYYTAANDVLNQLGAPSLAEGKQLNKQVAEGRADAQAKLAALAPALVTATVNSSNATQKKEAEELVSALPANVVQQTITALSLCDNSANRTASLPSYCLRKTTERCADNSGEVDWAELHRSGHP